MVDITSKKLTGPNIHMAKILVDNIEVGMELSSDVIDRQGRILLKSGVELNEKHLRVFNTWGILEVDVKGSGAQEEVQKVYSPELIEEARQYVTSLFQHNDESHPVIKNLQTYCKNQYMENKAS